MDKTKRIRGGFSCLALLIGLLVAPGLMAQERKEEMKEKKAEMMSYMKENILPRVAEQRKKLDEELSDKEQEELDDIREGFKQLMDERKEYKGKMWSEEDLSSDDWDMIRQAYMRKHRLMALAYDIAEDHEDRIDELLEELEPDANRWRKDMHKMKKEAWGSDHHRKGEKDESKSGEEGFKGHHRMHHHRHHHAGPIHLMDPVHFLLFDPEHMEEMMDEHDE